MKAALIFFVAPFIIGCGTELKERIKETTKECKPSWAVFKSRKEFIKRENNLRQKYLIGISISPAITCNIDEAEYRFQFDYYAENSHDLPGKNQEVVDSKLVLSGFLSEKNDFTCKHHNLEMSRIENGKVTVKIEATCTSDGKNSKKQENVFIDGELVLKEYL